MFARCVPPRVTHHSKVIVRVGGRYRLADSRRLRSARRFYESLFSGWVTGLGGPIRLEVVIVFPGRFSGWRPHAVRPDASNLVKVVEDALVRVGVFGDDGSVSDLVVYKRSGRPSGVGVRVCRIV